MYTKEIKRKIQTDLQDTDFRIENVTNGIFSFFNFHNFSFLSKY